MAIMIPRPVRDDIQRVPDQTTMQICRAVWSQCGYQSCLRLTRFRKTCHHDDSICMRQICGGHERLIQSVLLFVNRSEVESITQAMLPEMCPQAFLRELCVVRGENCDRFFTTEDTESTEKSAMEPRNKAAFSLRSIRQTEGYNSQPRVTCPISDHSAILINARLSSSDRRHQVHDLWLRRKQRKQIPRRTSALKPSSGLPPTSCGTTWTRRNTSTSSWV